MINKKYISVRDLEIYKIAREFSKVGWQIYERLDWHDKKIIGDQFITSTDSVGANIVEGYGRFHYLDKIKFYYNGRGSLLESSDYWVELLYERNKINKEEYQRLKKIAGDLGVKLNNLISGTYKAKENKK